MFKRVQHRPEYTVRVSGSIPLNVADPSFVSLAAPPPPPAPFSGAKKNYPGKIKLGQKSDKKCHRKEDVQPKKLFPSH